MKTSATLPIIGLALVLVAGGCAGGQQHESEMSMRDAATNDTEAVSAPVPAAAGNALPLNSPERKLIHAAQLHAEVPQLYGATARIEAMTMRLGGQVTNSSLQKSFREARTEREGADSLREIRRYSGTAVLSLRVPVANLDTLLGYIGAQTSFIDNRQLQIDDATFRHIENALRNRRLVSNDAVVAGASRADGLEARQYLDGRRSEAVGREVENLLLDDQAAYANLNIELSQPDEVVTRIIPDINRLMEPGAGTRFLHALRNGWEILYGLFLLLLGIWPVVILIAVGAVLGRRWHRRQQSAGRVAKV